MIISAAQSSELVGTGTGLVALLCYFPHEDLDCSSSTQWGDNIYEGRGVGSGWARWAHAHPDFCKLEGAALLLAYPDF